MQLKHAGGAAVWEAGKQDVYVHEVVFYSGVKMMCADYIDFTPTFVLDGYKLLNETYE
ncbi:hypothetical protein PF002_g24363 [Phytophthora fragariae]|uniref:Uncharacterized protein n=1 Tax=Phytophthora fragariae TaxID=53985 RepID=A0A6A3IF84_9STRA|nr:hypothetical protein PF011_g22224 [Phytophthora fragariae]KAE9191905.1 hypothetical protein PF002_g24363 [Phytophthora fragariae]